MSAETDTETTAATTVEDDDVIVAITDDALERIAEVRAGEDDPDALVLRMAINGINGVEYAYDLSFDPIADADEADAQYAQGGLPVIVPAGSIEQLTGATLDIPAGGGPGLVLRNPNRPDPLSGKHLELTGTIAEQVEQLLTEQVNPALAAHGGFAALKGVDDTVVYVTMGGGCQGCAVSAMTLRDGIARSITESIPEVTEVVDVTDHASGETPYYS